MTTQIEIFSHFGINQTNEIVKSDTYSRVEEVLDSTIRDHGWVAFAGQIGSGKTVTVFEALKSLRRDTSVHFVELISPDRKAINESSIVYTLMMHLGERFLGDTSMPRSNAARMIKVDRLLAKIKKEGRRVCLVIDEAQELANNTFNIVKRFRDVKLLSTGNTMSVVMIGQPALAGKIAQNTEVSLRCKTYDFSYTQAELVKIASHHSHGLLDEQQCRFVAEKAVSHTGDPTPLSIKRAIDDALENAYRLGEDSLSMYHFDFPEPAKKATRKKRKKITVAAGDALHAEKRITKEAS